MEGRRGWCTGRSSSCTHETIIIHWCVLCNAYLLINIHWCVWLSFTGVSCVILIYRLSFTGVSCVMLICWLCLLLERLNMLRSIMWRVAFYHFYIWIINILWVLIAMSLSQMTIISIWSVCTSHWYIDGSHRPYWFMVLEPLKSMVGNSEMWLHWYAGVVISLLDLQSRTCGFTRSTLM